MIDNNLSPDARAILEAGRDLDSPGDLERARVRRALLAKIAAGGTVLGALSAAASGAVTTGAAVGSSATLALPFAKVLIPLAIVIAGGVGGTVAWRVQRATTTPAALSAVAPAAKVAPVAPEIVQAPAPAVQRAAPTHRAHVAAPVRDEANRLPEEMALLAASNAELRGGDAARALALLDDYDRRYPAGVLREEVLATRVIARCQIGLEPDAAARHAADTFLRRHPASPLASRVRSSCAR
jgi:hypothetical protein